MAVFVAVLATADISGAHLNSGRYAWPGFSGLFDWINVALLLWLK
jgi:glycerol uptake facilitator protein